MRIYPAISPKLGLTLLIAATLSSACINPTESRGLDGGYTLAGEIENQIILPVLIDTTGYVTQGSLHIAGSHFTASIQFQRGRSPTGPVETANLGGNFSLFQEAVASQGFFGAGSTTFTEFTFRNMTGDLLGHPLGSWGTLDRDGQLLANGDLIIYFGNARPLLFVRD